MLEEEVARGREWWLYLKLALTYEAGGRPDDSLKAAYQALADGRDLSFRWEMAMLAGKLLQDLDPEAARDHVQLARRLRSDEGWPESRRLEELAVALELGAPDETASYVARLSKLWGQPTEQERRSGVVKVVLNAGSGFISPDDGSDDLYFGLSKDAKEEIPPAGTKVTFLVEQSYDHAKQRESLRATRVKRG
jgi:cold shock CspA family protein